MKYSMRLWNIDIERRTYYLQLIRFIAIIFLMAFSLNNELQAQCIGSTTSINIPRNIGCSYGPYSDATWDGAVGGSISDPGGTSSTFTVTWSTTGTFRLKRTPPSGCSGSPLYSAYFTITNVPTNPTPTPAFRCGTGTVALSGTPGANATTLRWYAALTGGTPLATATNYTTPSISSTTTYYIESYNAASDCFSSPRVAITATVRPVPNAAVSIASQQICSGQAMSTVTITNPNAVSGTTFSWAVSAPNISGASAGSGTTIAQTLSNVTTVPQVATYTITPTANSCAGTSITTTVTANPIPTAANAGVDQTVACGVTSTTLAANTPVIGTGSWTVVSGAGASFGNVSSPTSGFTGTAGSTYTLRWTIASGSCTSTDNVLITFNGNPTTANAGIDQTGVSTCDQTSVSLAGNVPALGTGVWSIINGTGGTITNPSSNNSAFIGTSGNSYTLRWTISNSPCPSSTDEVVIAFNRTPTSANAGLDQTSKATCGLTSMSLTGNAPVVGVGSWSIIVGSGGSFVNASSSTTTFNGTPGVAYTLRWTISNGPCTSSIDDVNIKFNNDFAFCSNENYILSSTLLTAGVTNGAMVELLPAEQASESIQYFDGLGRLMQNIAIEGSPTKKDIVTPIVYDELGRNNKSYLPFTAPTNAWYKPNNTIIHSSTGAYIGIAEPFYSTTTDKIADDTRPFSETVFETSPLNRPFKDFGPGQDWSNNNRAVTHGYVFNLDGTGQGLERILDWNVDSNGIPVKSTVTNSSLIGGYYRSGQLRVKSTKDEHGNEVREYVDKEGHIILKKVQVFSGTPFTDNDSHWAYTYYIYDDLGNLRVVLPPEAVRALMN